MSKLTVATATAFAATLSMLHGNAALEDANQLQRQNAEYNQEQQQSQQLNQQYNEQNLENQNFDTEINNSDQLEVTPPQPLWNNGPGGF